MERPHGFGGGRPPVAGGEDVKFRSSPSSVVQDACCGQLTYNTGVEQCCAFGKKDEDHHIHSIDDTCPPGSSTVMWDPTFEMDYDMDDMMMHMMDDIVPVHEPLY